MTYRKVSDGHSVFRQLGLAEASRRLNALNDLTSNPIGLGTSEVHNYTSILEELFVYTLMDQDVSAVGQGLFGRSTVCA